MLTYLLASDPATSPSTLTAMLAEPALSGDALTAVLLRPELDPDAALLDASDLSADQAHQVLNAPTTNATRRAQLLATLGRTAWCDLLCRHATFTPEEIDTFADAGGPLEKDGYRAAAVATNPNTSNELATQCLQVAVHYALEPLAVLLLAEERDLDPRVIADLAARIPPSDRARLETYLDGSEPDRTLVARAIDAGPRTMRAVMRQTRSINLFLEALDTPDFHTTIARLLPHGHPQPEPRGKLDALRRYLDRRLPAPATSDDIALEAARSAGSTFGLDLLPAKLLPADLTADTLRLVVDAVNERDADSLTAVLSTVGAHPNCPDDLVEQVATSTSAPIAPPASLELWAAHRITRARAAGEMHPGLTLPVTIAGDIQPASTPTSLEHWTADAVTTHPSWPLSPEAAAAYIALERDFAGTVGELLDTAAAVSA